LIIVTSDNKKATGQIQKYFSSFNELLYAVESILSAKKQKGYSELQKK
jgi:hypothetical protein